MTTPEINPFDILSGKVVKNESGTFYFKEAGDNMLPNGCPIDDKLHRENGLPAVIWASGNTEYWVNGEIITASYY